MKLLTIVVLIEMLHCGYGYPSGAPQSACSTLIPVHKENTPQETRSPYTVTARNMGDRVRVSISSPSSMDFQGFIIQARYANDRNRIADGRFTTQRQVSQTIDCGRGRENTLTQVNKNPKSDVVTDWTPAPGLKDDIIFRATVANTFSRYWTNIETTPVRISSKGSSAKQNQELDMDRMYDNCFVSKGCFGYPADCVTRMECDILLTYVNTGEGVLFTMTGSLGSSENYMAAGLSRDRKMGDDSVTECFMENGRVMTQTSWNKGRSNSPLTLVPEGMYDWNFKDGVASCSWTRPYVTVVEGKTFDLTNSTYYILIAKGPMSDGHVGYHNGRLSSQDSVNFTAYEMISGERAHDAVKVHGTTSQEEKTEFTVGHTSNPVFLEHDTGIPTTGSKQTFAVTSRHSEEPDPTESTDFVPSESTTDHHPHVPAGSGVPSLSFEPLLLVVGLFLLRQ